MMKPFHYFLFCLLFLCCSSYAQNVGIGTNTPVNKLSVNGKVNITDSLGIGTPTPAARLDVAGSIRVADGTQGAGKLLRSNANGLAKWDSIKVEDIFTTDPGYQLCPTVTGGVATQTNPSSIAVAGNYAYVVSTISSSLETINISNPAAPAVVATTGNASGTTSIAVAGNYAYLVNQGFNAIVPLSLANPAAPSPIGGESLGPTGSPVVITVSGNYAFVLSTAPNTMKVVNLANPLIPTVVGSVPVQVNPVAIAVSGNYAYVINANSSNLQVINISTPAAPITVGFLTFPAEPSAVAVSGNYVYVVSRVSNQLYTINVSNAAAPTIVASIATGAQSKSVFVSANYAYVTNESNNTLQIFNISTPTAPYLAATVGTNAAPRSVVVQGNYAYVINFTGSTTQVINTSFCPISYMVAVNPAAGQTIATPLQWTTSGSNIHNSNTGNVGIGTTTPLGKLHIAKAGDAELYLENTSSRKWSLQSNSTASGTNTTFQIIDRNLNVSRLGIDNNGLVGINTTTPATTLDVNGGIKTKYSGTAVVPVSPSTTTAYQIGIPSLPAGWDYTNTVVLVSAADGAHGYVKQVKLTSLTNIDVYFEALQTGPVRFNWIIFKM